MADKTSSSKRDVSINKAPQIIQPTNIDNLNVGFPVYAVEYYAATNLLFIAGGGGPTKSGVRNVIVRGDQNYSTDHSPLVDNEL